MNKISANLFLGGSPTPTSAINSDLKREAHGFPYMPKRATHHIWVKRGSNLLINEIFPVN